MKREAVSEIYFSSCSQTYNRVVCKKISYISQLHVVPKVWFIAAILFTYRAISAKLTKKLTSYVDWGYLTNRIASL